MLQHVAVVEEESWVVLETQQDAHTLLRHHEHGVLPSLVNDARVVRAPPSRAGGGTPDHPELQAVHMH